jgi:hypothetical protein
MNTEKLRYAVGEQHRPEPRNLTGDHCELVLQFESGGVNGSFRAGDSLPVVAARLEQLAQHLRGIANGVKKWDDPLQPLCSDAGTLCELQRRIDYCAAQIKAASDYREADELAKVAHQLELCAHDVRFLRGEETR